MTFDYRLRYEYEIADPTTFAAYDGWKALTRRPERGLAPPTAWGDLVAALGSLTTRANPVHGSLTHAEEIELARLCGLLSLFEQVYRMGGVLDERAMAGPIARADLSAPLEDLLAIVDDRLPPDVAAMMSLFRSSAPELRRPSTVVTSPAFTRSRDLGGADGDIILDRLLLEVKAVRNTGMTKAIAWQLLGYLLADTDDLYEIETVGWYFARQGTLWCYPVEEFLRRLSGEVVDLAAARAEFAKVCTRLQPGARTDSWEGVRTEQGRRPLTEAMRPTGVKSALEHYVERVVKCYPPARGTGRWHVPLSEVPRNVTLYDEPDPNAAACGASVPLDLTADPRIPEIGTSRVFVGDELCANCRVFTDSSYSPDSNDGSARTDNRSS